jgi:AcrR family transcriptional regulator
VSPAKTARAEQTRALIVDTALHLFTENGYEATTMRAIAQKAGVATGNAYYYFASKDDLVGEFYALAVAAHVAASQDALSHETGLAARLRGVLIALIDAQAPYHAFAVPLSARADVPSPARDAELALFGQVVSGTRTRVPGSLRDHLPGMLWLYAQGVARFWAHDTSPEFQRTRGLIEATAPLAARMVRLARYPLLRGLSRDLLASADAVLRPASMIEHS